MSSINEKVLIENMAWIKPLVVAFLSLMLFLIKGGNKKNEKKSEKNPNKTEEEVNDSSQNDDNLR